MNTPSTNSGGGGLKAKLLIIKLNPAKWLKLILCIAVATILKKKKTLDKFQVS